MISFIIIIVDSLRKPVMLQMNIVINRNEASMLLYYGNLCSFNDKCDVHKRLKTKKIKIKMK